MPCPQPVTSTGDNERFAKYPGRTPQSADVVGDVFCRNRCAEDYKGDSLCENLPFEVGSGVTPNPFSDGKAQIFSAKLQ